MNAAQISSFTILLIYIRICSEYTYLDFTNRLNAALLAFDIDQNIAVLINASMSLRELGQNSLANQVDDITTRLTEIQNNQIPTIQNQTVSTFGSVNHGNAMLLRVEQIGSVVVVSCSQTRAVNL